MNYGAEPADQVVRYTLEGTEFALKISGTAAKNFAVFALAVLRDQKKTHGKTKLVRLLREGKPLKFFSVPTDQMRDFSKAAKSHGLLYVPIQITIHCFKQNLSFKAKQAHASRLRLLCSC